MKRFWLKMSPRVGSGHLLPPEEGGDGGMNASQKQTRLQPQVNCSSVMKTPNYSS